MRIVKRVVALVRENVLHKRFMHVSCLLRSRVDGVSGNVGSQGMIMGWFKEVMTILSCSIVFCLFVCLLSVHLCSVSFH